MYALITGASRGLGKSFAYQLAEKGYDLVLVARNKEDLNNIGIDISEKYENKVVILDLDLTKQEDIDKLFKVTETFEIEVVINNAGLGKVGLLNEISDYDDETMIKLNVLAMHKVLKHYNKMMEKGYILSVCSIASFSAGPKMATYYATKNYMLALSKAVSYENKKSKRPVFLSALCPGPVNTSFNEVANVKFALKGMSSDKCAKKGLKGLFKKKRVITPALKIGVAKIFMKILPSSFVMGVCYRSQTKKNDKK